MRVSKDKGSETPLEALRARERNQATHPRHKKVVLQQCPDHLNPITNLVFHHTPLVILFLLLIDCFVAQTCPPPHSLVPTVHDLNLTI